jgi:AcrR family transcriptional regulator
MESASGKSSLNAGGRLAKRRRLTRARLLESAYQVMSRTGVDAAKIQEITDKADIGFGTFYNYFETKDQLASQVLDCVINDLGRRNEIATRRIRSINPALVMPLSIRLWLHEAMHAPMWEWWVLRPDLLVNRMREGFGPFGMRDMRDAISCGTFKIAEKDVEPMWALACWTMVGGMHDIDIGRRPDKDEFLVVESIMRMMGVESEAAKRLSRGTLPKLPPAGIDWSFEIARNSCSDSQRKVAIF